MSHIFPLIKNLLSNVFSFLGRLRNTSIFSVPFSHFSNLLRINSLAMNFICLKYEPCYQRSTVLMSINWLFLIFILNVCTRENVTRRSRGQKWWWICFLLTWKSYQMINYLNICSMKMCCYSKERVGKSSKFPNSNHHRQHPGLLFPRWEWWEWWEYLAIVEVLHESLLQ